MKAFWCTKVPPFLFCLLLEPLTCCSRTEEWGRYSPHKAGRLTIEELLSRPKLMMLNYQTPEAKGIHYAEACNEFGAVRFAVALKDTELLARLAQRYAIARTDTIPNSANHVDVNVFGILPLELYRAGIGEEFLEQGMKYANGQWEDQLPGGLTRQVCYWIDDIWMIAALQVQAYRVVEKPGYLHRAA